MCDFTNFLSLLPSFAQIPDSGLCRGIWEIHAHVQKKGSEVYVTFLIAKDLRKVMTIIALSAPNVFLP